MVRTLTSCVPTKVNNLPDHFFSFKQKMFLSHLTVFCPCQENLLADKSKAKYVLLNLFIF